MDSGCKVSGDGSPDNNKEPLMEEFCWQAKVLEGGLAEVMGRRNLALERKLSDSSNEPWQCHFGRCFSITHRALPRLPSPSANLENATDIFQNRDSCPLLGNLYADPQEMEQSAL